MIHSTLQLRLQNGRFDAPDRLFSSMRESWESVNTSSTDVKVRGVNGKVWGVNGKVWGVNGLQHRSTCMCLNWSGARLLLLLLH